MKKDLGDYHASVHRKRNNRTANKGEIVFDSHHLEIEPLSRRSNNQRIENSSQSSKKCNNGTRSPRSEKSGQTHSSKYLLVVFAFIAILYAVLVLRFYQGNFLLFREFKENNRRANVVKSSKISQSQKKDQRKRHWPRIIYMEKEWTLEKRHKRRHVEIESTRNTLHDKNEWQQPRESQGGKCLPKSEWQTKSNPNCNIVHEIDFATATVKEIIGSSINNVSHSTEDNFKLLGEGWFRTTWQLDRSIVKHTIDQSNHHDHNHIHAYAIQDESVVLKTLRIEREFLSEYYELHRRDAVAMERLTKSNFVVNVFGFCAQSAINELANFNYHGIQNLETFNRRLRGLNSPKSAEMKIRLAASVALGVADIHAAGENIVPIAHNGRYKDSVYMVHYDLNPRNIALFSGGRPKINDFNIAEFLRYDPVTGATCGFPSRLHEPWWRAPEEMNTNATEEGILLDEKVDVYALGNILYHTLTSYAPWGKMKNDRIPEVRLKVAKGQQPQIPRVYAHDKNRHVKAIVKAISMCWVLDPAKRSSAREVAEVLYTALAEVKESSDMIAQSQSEKLNNGQTIDTDDGGVEEVEDKGAMVQ